MKKVIQLLIGLIVILVILITSVANINHGEGETPSLSEHDEVSVYWAEEEGVVLIC